jgi:hypothetical protein
MAFCGAVKENERSLLACARGLVNWQLATFHSLLLRIGARRRDKPGAQAQRDGLNEVT